MLLTTFIAIVLGLWSSFHLLHNFSYNNGIFGSKLQRFLHHNNIFITPFHIRWFTARWNRWISGTGKWQKLNSWFDAGVIFGAASMVFSVPLLGHTLKNTVADLWIFREPSQAPVEHVLTVVMPGVNVPFGDIGYLFSSILACGIFHELGHAIAAAREGIKMEGFAIFLFVIYPGAGVHLDSEDLNNASTRKQLRIYCAGVWHNFVICLVATIMILVLPILVLPLYSHTGEGVVVTQQTEESPLLGESGLHPGDIITDLDRCKVRGSEGWLSCINETIVNVQKGSCITADKLDRLKLAVDAPLSALKSPESYVDCCGIDPPPTHLCYKHVASSAEHFACLPGRVVMAGFDCLNNQDCAFGGKSTNVCATPYLEKTVRFVRITAKRNSNPPSVHHVLFLGQPVELLRHVTVSEYQPRFSWLPLKLPAVLLRFLQYIFSMSGALALFNIVPCYALDGQWVFKAFLDHFYSQQISQEKKELVCLVVLTAGTALIAANIIFGFLDMWWR